MIDLPDFLFNARNIKPNTLIVLANLYIQADDFLEVDFVLLDYVILTGLNKKDISQAIAFLEHNKLISHVTRNKGKVSITLYDPETIKNNNMQVYYNSCLQSISERKKIKEMNRQIKPIKK